MPFTLVGRTQCGALRDLVQFVQFKKHKKYPWRNITYNFKQGHNNGILNIKAILATTPVPE